MNKTTKIVIIEDLPSDAELAKRELKKVFPNPIYRVVDCKEKFVEVLIDFIPDIIISDFKLPLFDGLSALKITRELSPNTPFVILTGSINEDTAVECMKAGADDYVIKEHVKRLSSAAVSAVKKKKAEVTKKRSEKEYKQLIENMNDTILVLNFEGKFVEVNNAAVNLLGYTREELLSITPYMLDAQLSASDISNLLKNLTNGKSEKQIFETTLVTKDSTLVPVEINSNIISYKGEKVILSIVRDLTQRKHTEDLLQKSEIRFSKLFDNSTLGVVICKLVTDEEGRTIDFIFLKANRAIEKHIGFAPESIEGQLCSTLFSEEETIHFVDKFSKVVESGDPYDHEYHLQTIDRTIDNRSFFLENDFFALTFQDISKRIAAFKQIKTDLQEKRSLLKELYHRTKNNMQVISSMLKIELRRNNNSTLQNSYREVIGKINAMALVHQKLYQEKDLSRVNLEDYIRDLVDSIKKDYNNQPNISFDLNLDRVRVLIDTAIPLGLVLNELITNIYKHAFPDKSQGSAQLFLHVDNENFINLKLSDNGIGIANGLDLKEVKTMGLHTVYSLIEHQLMGNISYQNESGLSWSISLKDTINKERI